MKKFIIALVIVIAVIAASVYAAWYVQSSQKLDAGPPESITIGVPRMFDSSALVYIADDQGFFTDIGLNVTIKEYDAGLYAVDDMLKGNSDIAVATEIVLVGKALNREKICSIGSIAKYQTHYIIGRKDRGVENFSDLRGKRIGFARGTSGEFYLGRYLELRAINLPEVTLVDVRPAQYTDAIVNGSVDAIIVWEPYVEPIKDQLGANATIWPAQSGQLGYWNAICRDDWAAQHPELVNRFLRSIDRAEKYTIYHTAESKTIVQKRLNADDKYVASVWNNTQFGLSLDQSLIVAMDDEGRWMINNGLTDVNVVPDYQDNIYLTGMNAVKPESVNIVI
ncbi:ABC transporter substrate binding protein [Methanocella paludicola SANAE]|uniref:ABC transporter substrate binding protein n=1 Tax=Methanocella paludicola (strain DSM 17711 / JCM 13418 / NBRC 101707 / SANAE) TaxID=304371 RepID=D1YZF8_METPS|nr:NrtA/SsuA/CpmA family ABC transporter substrate-binding protein [Methanocella paludicola]BAI61830.1 ABC transporter substrate binding protein [Methanocella paludicola SANAE]